MSLGMDEKQKEYYKIVIFPKAISLRPTDFLWLKPFGHNHMFAPKYGLLA